MTSFQEGTINIMQTRLLGSLARIGTTKTGMLSLKELKETGNRLRNSSSQSMIFYVKTPWSFVKNANSYYPSLLSAIVARDNILLRTD